MVGKVINAATSIRLRAQQSVSDSGQRESAAYDSQRTLLYLPLSSSSFLYSSETNLS